MNCLKTKINQSVNSDDCYHWTEDDIKFTEKQACYLAHNINNSLSILQGYVRRIASLESLSEEGAECVENAKRHVKIMSDFIKSTSND